MELLLIVISIAVALGLRTIREDGAKRPVRVVVPVAEPRKRRR